MSFCNTFSYRPFSQYLPYLGLSEHKILEDSDGWLNDNIVNASQDLLKRQYPNIGGCQNTLLGQNLSFSIERKDFVQILHGLSHWLCVSSIGCKEGEVEVIDSSISDSIPQNIIRQVAALLHTDKPQLKLTILDTAQQKGSSACGLYAIASITALCSGIDPTAISFNQELMRSHLMECLESGKMRTFPSNDRFVMKRVKGFQKETLHCHCRQPSSEKMIKCRVCGDWFHGRCESVSLNNWRKPSSWNCAKC